MSARTPTVVIAAGLAAAGVTAALLWRRRARTLPRQQDRALAGALLALHELQGEAARIALPRPLAPSTHAFAWRQLRLSERGRREAALLAPLRAPFGEEIHSFAQTLLADLEDGPEARFEERYGQSMVRAHQEALIWFNERLLPAAWDPQVRLALERARRQTLSRLDGALQLLRDPPADVTHPDPRDPAGAVAGVTADSSDAGSIAPQAP